MNENKTAFVTKLCAWLGGILVVTYAILFLVQVWSEGMIASDIFVKLTITYLVLGAGVVVVFLLYREVKNESTMKKDNYLD